MDIIMTIIIPTIVGLFCLIIGMVLGFSYRKNVSEKTIGSAEEEAQQIVEDGIKNAENKKKEALIEAKDEIHKNRKEFDAEVRERRAEISKLEKRLASKEESLDKKIDNLEKKEDKIDAQNKKLAKLNEEAEEFKSQQVEILEKISGLTREQAKEQLVYEIEQSARHDAAVKLKEIFDKNKEEADKNARELISRAIQRCAADHVAEATVSVVPLPSDEMKGRIIGREGRNIRTLETLTGVDLIIDDTPEAITLSAFDPVRREVARMTLEKLIQDGRIHPSRIEDTVEKCKKEIDQIIKQEGERATFEVGVHNLHPELVKTLGRMKYRTSYGQNVLKHSVEVAHLCGIMAAELGVDVTLAKRAGLLHDLGKAIDHEVEGTHVQIGVDLAKKYRENPQVIHAIHAHHGDVEAETALACIVQACDAISAARPGARRENIENYIKRLEKLESLANSIKGVERSFAVQAGREIRIIVNPDDVSDDNMILLARELSQKIEGELQYPGQIKVHMIRETRAIDFAK
ncbi:MAG: ribonuclease Y [Clostridia bacterium]